jgi:hypothetical protein
VRLAVPCGRTAILRNQSQLYKLAMPLLPGGVSNSAN